MSHRVDTLLRLVLLVAAIAAAVAMFQVAGDESLDRTGRFLRLALWGAVTTGVAVTVDIGTKVADRVPLYPRWGRPARPAGPAVSPPDPIVPETASIVSGLRIKPTLGALGGAAVVVFVAGSLGYALARTAHTDGGLLLYVAFAAGCLLAVRSVFRLVTSRRALTLDGDGITLGPPLGYLPPHTIARHAVTTIEIATVAPPKIAVVDASGRRYEIRPDHLTTPELIGNIAALWPEVEWRELPKSTRKY